MRDQDVLEDLLVAPPAAEEEPPATRRERRGTPAAPGRRPPAPPVLRAYQRGRSLVGVALIGLLFVAAWLLNGYFTARLIVSLGGSWGLGITTHLITTVVELTTVFVSPALRRVRAPLGVHLLIWTIVLPFGVFDTGSSALGLVEWGLALGLPIGLSLHGAATGLALIIAFVPEPMLVWLSVAVQSELRR